MVSRYTRAIASMVACALVGGLALLVAEPGARAAQADGWASGVYPGPCKNNSDADRVAYVNQLKAFGTWRKQPVQFTMQFAPYEGVTNWLTNEEPNSLFKCAVYVRQQLHVPMMFAVPMLPQFDTEALNPPAGTPSPTLAQGAAGAYDQYWKTLATNLVSRGLADTTMRIGWEFNGDWFRWSAVNDPTNWTKYWIRIVKAMRSVKGQAFKFDYSVALGSIKTNPDDSSHPGKGGAGIYPGDAYVDSVSVSVYDQITGKPACGTVVSTSCTTASQRWASLRDQTYGLDWQADFAARHNKPIAFSEWALATNTSFKGGGGGDDSTFITLFHQWLSNPTSKTGRRATVAYEIYFDKNHQNNIQMLTDGLGHDSTNFPDAEDAYQAKWAVTSGHSPSASVLPSTGLPSSSSTPTVTVTPSSSATPTATPAPKPPANIPLYSKTSIRAYPRTLSKAKLTQNSIFVFVRPAHAVLYAAWYVDDSKRTKKAYHVSRLTPYDLVGKNGTHALAFKVSGLKKGSHTMTVLLRWKTGGYRTYTVTYTR